MAHVGSMKCPMPACAGTAAVSHSASGVRNVKCPHCGFSGYGPQGSRSARLIDQATTLSDDDAPQAKKAAPAPPAPAPTAAPRKPTTLMG